MKIVEKIKENKKIAIIVLLALICVVLLVISELLPSEKEEKEVKTSEESIEYNYAQEIETKLTDMISQINGAGNAKVMVTLENSAETVYATNENIQEEKNEIEYVLIKTGSQESGLLLKIIAPEIRGVAVVCQGGESASVRAEITDMVTSVLDISSNRVSVIKMK